MNRLQIFLLRNSWAIASYCHLVGTQLKALELS